MAATGFTPVYLYASGITGHIPLAINLTNTSNGSEIALNYYDGNLFFKNASNSVITTPLLQSSSTQSGWLSSTDWSTFNSKQPAGTYVTSVTGTAPVVSSGGTTPAISMAAATSSVNGYLTSTDWTTFNNKAPSVTYTSNYVPYGQGTTTPALSSNFQFNGTTLTLANDAAIHGMVVGLGSGSVATNAAFGTGALGGVNTGTNSTALGYAALNNQTSGGYNTAVGNSAMHNNQTGFFSACFGDGAGYSSTGGGISAFGSNVLAANNTGIANSAFGGRVNSVQIACMASNTSGSYNAAFGCGALGSNTVANFNTAVGYSALVSANRTADTNGYNVGIGANAGSNLTTGQYGIYIGEGCQASAGSVAQEMVIGAGATGKGSTTGFISVGGGGVYQSNNSASWSTTSDQRIKENINEITGLDVILQLRPVSFDYIETKQQDIGFIAQEYMEVLPSQVQKHAANKFEKELVGEDEVYGITPNLVPYLVKAIQELKAEFDAYKATHP